MNKKRVLIILIILIAIIAVAGYFIIDKINTEKRKYTIEEVSEYKYFVSKINDQYGVIDTSGKTIIEPNYNKVEIPNPSKDVFICYKDEKGIACNANKQQLFAEYNSVQPIALENVATDLPYEKSVLKCEKNGKYGLIDFFGNKILSTEYDNIKGFTNREGQIQVTQNGKLGVVNIKGAELVKPEYDEIAGDDYSGYTVGVKGEDGYKYGYINDKGKMQLKTEYDSIDSVANEHIITSKDSQYGVMKNKKELIKNEYQAIEYDNTNQVFILQKNKTYGLADIKGNIVIPVENASVHSKGEYIYVDKNNNKQVYDPSGNKVDIDFNKTIMATTNENYKITIDSEENNNYYGVANASNRQIIKPQYLYIEYAFDNYFIVCGQNGKLGVLDDKGNEIVELKYDLVQKVQGKNVIQTLLSEENITELYSPNMKQICEIANATVENKDGFIKIYSSNEIHYYNSEGIETPSSKVFPNYELFSAVEDGKWGYIDASGNTKIAFEYEHTKEFNDYGFAAVKKDGKWGCIDSNGNIVVEPTYELNDTYGAVEFIGEYMKVQSGYGDAYYTKDV